MRTAPGEEIQWAISHTFPDTEIGKKAAIISQMVLQHHGKGGRGQLINTLLAMCYDIHESLGVVVSAETIAKNAMTNSILSIMDRQNGGAYVINTPAPSGFVEIETTINEESTIDLSLAALDDDDDF